MIKWHEQVGRETSHGDLCFSHSPRHNTGIAYCHYIAEHAASTEKSLLRVAFLFVLCELCFQGMTRHIAAQRPRALVLYTWHGLLGITRARTQFMHLRIAFQVIVRLIIGVPKSPKHVSKCRPGSPEADEKALNKNGQHGDCCHHP